MSEVTEANNNTSFAETCKQLHKMIDEFTGPEAETRRWRATLMQTEQSVREGLTKETTANYKVSQMIKEAALYSDPEFRMGRK